MNTRQIDFEKTQLLVRRVFEYVQGSVVSAMVHLGDALGLYRALWNAGPLTAGELADRTGLHERWVLEWLRGQASADLVDATDDERYELSAEQAAVLADEEGSVFFAAGAFTGLPEQMGKLPLLAKSFRTGIGLPYDAAGPGGAMNTERMFAPWYRHMLVPVILPGVAELADKLKAGAKLADIGCGAGVAIIEMAKAFPASDFHGFDNSRHALARAEANRKSSSVANVTFHDASADAIPQDATFDVVTAFDCIHDMTHPLGALRAARGALRPDGVLLVADIKGYPTLAENRENNPMAAMMYGMSVLSCMSSAMSEPGGAGLGTLGFHPDVARAMLAEAGFASVQIHDLGHPVNLYYEARP